MGQVDDWYLEYEAGDESDSKPAVSRSRMPIICLLSLLVVGTVIGVHLGRSHREAQLAPAPVLLQPRQPVPAPAPVPEPTESRTISVCLGCDAVIFHEVARHEHTDGFYRVYHGVVNLYPVAGRLPTGRFYLDPARKEAELLKWHDDNSW